MTQALAHRPVGFTGNPLDRMDAIREDVAAFNDMISDPRSRLLSLDGLDPITDQYGNLVWTNLAQAPDDAHFALLGVLEGRAHFVALPSYEVRGRPAWQLFQALAALNTDHAAIYALARSLILWHTRHRFCANCGNETVIERAGWSRKCGRCDAQHFPRTDPVVIMLAEYEGRILLGRQPHFPPQRYSALAGFLELGESVEDAVTRELKEEAGVDALSVRYVTSQPWPFPSSLMIGCIAKVANDTITLDTKELEDAIWVDRADVAAALAGDPAAPFIAPPPYTIACSLLNRWLDGA